MDDDVYAATVPRKRFVHGVVDELVDEVVESFGASRADIHARALADRFEAFEDLDVFAGV
jgi:hypothetical protein